MLPPPLRELWLVTIPSDYPTEYRLGVVVYDQNKDLIHGQGNKYAKKSTAA